MRTLVIGTLLSTGTFLSEYPRINNLSTMPDGRCSDIVVAVIDTGIDYNHPELNPHLWKNRGELGEWTPPSGSKTKCRDKSCNGLDDDKNGYKDDVIGWDFVLDKPLPYDVHGHGTHISGIVSSQCPPQIMTLKYSDGGMGYNNMINTVRAVDYAIKNGAHVINYSSGGSDPSPTELRALTKAYKEGILFVPAAGNEGRNNDRRPYYPASYRLPNIISVGAHNRYLKYIPSSNFGKSVHVAAPGLMILSTLPGGRFGTMSGTSQATAFVTGAAVRLWAENPRATALQIRELILVGADPVLPKQTVSSGILNVTRSLKLQKEGF